jgi:hypothetical protein
MTIHKQNQNPTAPAVSIILLDWSCRESLHTLDWLSRQDLPRNRYELIWVELYDRVLPVVMEKADVVITCNQRGLPNKHAAYNSGILQARGQLVTISDSDAVYPVNFVSSLLSAFELNAGSTPRSLVLMQYEWRSPQTYPVDLREIAQVAQYTWWDLWPNVGACMTVRREDAIRFGGFDEHRSFRGHRAGPYDLGWRLVNAGIPEVWHDPRTSLWHFAHANSDKPDDLWGRNRTVYPHLSGHVLTAVEAFSTGRILPRKENHQIHTLRLSLRHIGTDFEKNYATMTGPTGFSALQIVRFWCLLWLRQLRTASTIPRGWLVRALKLVLGEETVRKLKVRRRSQ